jgi:thymidine kinase
MYHGTRPGWIEVVAGVMFSGKSEELLRRVRRAVLAKRKVQLFKSHIDDRYKGIYAVSTHDGVAAEAQPVNSAADIVRSTRIETTVIAIDEAQFLDEGIVEVATMLANRGVRVILAGTDTDFRGKPFGAMPELMAVAEIVDKLHAICVICGDPACRNQRLINGRPALYGSPTIMVGGSESYEARCRHCHSVPRADAAQVPLFDRREEGSGKSEEYSTRELTPPARP